MQVSGDTRLSVFCRLEAFTFINIVPYGQPIGKSQILKTRATTWRAERENFVSLP